MMSVPLTAQASALRVICDRANRHTLKRGGFCMRDSEADLLQERLSAALETLEKLSEGRA